MGTAKRCIFCDRNADSAEHIWPVWMHPLLPVHPGRHDRKLFEFHPSTGKRESGPAGRQGDLRTVRIRAVCKNCNETWMSRLETAARPLLSPMALGQQVNLDTAAQEIVARWIALKIMVSEHSRGDMSLTTQEDRTLFKDEGLIPSYYRIYITSHMTSQSTGFYRHSVTLTLSSEGLNPPLRGAVKNVQTISMMVGKIFVHHVADRVRDFTFEERVIFPQLYNSARLWPAQQAEMSWPRRPLLDGDGANFIALGLERYLSASKINWTDEWMQQER